MILITGASRGIGKFLFDKFTEKGETVYGTYFSENSECSKNKKYFHLEGKDSEFCLAHIAGLVYQWPGFLCFEKLGC